MMSVSAKDYKSVVASYKYNLLDATSFLYTFVLTPTATSGVLATFYF